MRPLHWIASTLRCVRSFPEEVRQEVGYAIHLAQSGDKATNAIPMVGFGSSKVLEVVVTYDGDAYRAVYTVKFAKAVYALHAFQKKSHTGSQTPKHDIGLIKRRMKHAEQHYKQNYSEIQKDVKDGRGRQR